MLLAGAHRGCQSSTCFGAHSHRIIAPALSSYPPRRHQSSKVAAASPPSISPPYAKSTIQDLLVPPPSTRPPPFSPVQRSPSDSNFTYYRALGKSYLTFYKTAVKHLWRTDRLASKLERQDRTSGAVLSSRDWTKRFEPSRRTPSQSFSSNGGVSPAVSRAEWQVQIRARENRKCIPPFLLLFVVFGEWTPLIAPFFLRIIPYSAKTPSMLENERKGLEVRRREMLRSGLSGRVLEIGAAERKKLTNGAKGAMETGEGAAMRRIDVSGLSSDELFAVSTSLDISTRAWSHLERLPFLPVLRWRVRRALHRLAVDDALFSASMRTPSAQKQLASSGAKGDQSQRVKALTLMDSEEVCIMAVSRGADVVGRRFEDVIKDVAAWFEAREQGRCMEELLLSRPTYNLK